VEERVWCKEVTDQPAAQRPDVVSGTPTPGDDASTALVHNGADRESVAVGADVTSRGASDRRSTVVQRVLLQGVSLIGFAVLFGIFSALTPSLFPTWTNVKSILDLASPTLILAVGLTVVLVVGEFDLSFTGIASLAAVIAVKVMGGGGSATVAVLAALGVGLAGGLIAGIAVAAQRASSFIITLALGTVWSGLALGISGGGGQTLTTVTNGYLAIAENSLAGIPLMIIIAAVVALLGAVILRFTVIGREVTAVGNNPSAARLSGVSLASTRVFAYVLLGLCSAIAAILLSSQTGQFSPDMSTGLLIPPFVAAFFGTSVLMRGRFNIFGTIVGGLFIATLQTGLVLEGILDWVSSVIIGAVLVIILFIAAESRRRLA
jgi:ribose transport system permease protein